jgi:DNA invertase Pin-like site-specific DNA recombinase
MTDAKLLIPAAQYLRMSTEHQQYSFENQSAVIQKYAESHGFEVVRTYPDAAKRGVVLRNRTGLQQLLHDVVAGTAEYKAILVYDVSRWGRFQDTDESAHYEFLCRSAGVPVHYCAEPFANDGSLLSSIMKALKRTMAGEYSRELGVKVIAGQKRLAERGFKQGGIPGYGFRRFLVSENRIPKQLLANGDLKSIATDRVILVPAPASEVSTSSSRSCQTGKQSSNCCQTQSSVNWRLRSRQPQKSPARALLGTHTLRWDCPTFLKGRFVQPLCSNRVSARRTIDTL